MQKVIKTVSYVPHFISTVVMVSILNLVLSPVSGIYGNLYRAFGGVGYPADIRPQAAAFRHLYVWSGVWQQLGWNSIIYVSALSGVSAELHEAAQIDGASIQTNDSHRPTLPSYRRYVSCLLCVVDT